jgi:anti-anti-sigma factor
MKNTSVEISARHGHTWVVLPDTIDMDNYLRIERKITTELDRFPNNLVLDFGKTKALFSSGIGMILRLRTATEEKKLAIYIVNMDTGIKEGLENVGLDKAFRLFTSEEQFLSAVSD